MFKTACLLLPLQLHGGLSELADKSLDLGVEFLYLDSQPLIVPLQRSISQQRECYYLTTLFLNNN